MAGRERDVPEVERIRFRVSVNLGDVILRRQVGWRHFTRAWPPPATCHLGLWPRRSSAGCCSALRRQRLHRSAQSVQSCSRSASNVNSCKTPLPWLCSASVGIGEATSITSGRCYPSNRAVLGNLTNPHTYPAPSFLTGGGLGCNTMQFSSTSTMASG
jgi:hypothetical protein